MRLPESSAYTKEPSPITAQDWSWHWWPGVSRKRPITAQGPSIALMAAWGGKMAQCVIYLYYIRYYIVYNILYATRTCIHSAARLISLFLHFIHYWIPHEVPSSISLKANVWVQHDPKQREPFHICVYGWIKPTRIQICSSLSGESMKSTVAPSNGRLHTGHTPWIVTCLHTWGILS